MGVDLDTYRARIGSFISRRNVNCDDEKRKIAIIKERFRLKIGLKAVDSWKLRVPKCTTLNTSEECTYGLEVHFSSTFGHLSPKSTSTHVHHQCGRHSSKAVAMFILVSYRLIKQLLILSGNVEMNPGPVGQHSEGEGSSNPPLLKDLVVLKVPPTKWYQLGLQLNLDERKLDMIKTNNQANVEACIMEMFKEWLKNTADASYAELESALNRMGEHSVAASVLPSSSCENRYIRDLKKRYHSLMPLVQEDFPPLQTFSFTNLTLIKDTTSTHKEQFYLNTIQGSADDIDETKVTISYHDLFESITSDNRILLLEGRPGCGKTTLTRKISKDWGEGTILSFVKYLFLIPLRQFSKKPSSTLEISTILKHFDATGLENELLQIGGESVCFIFDGLDEYSDLNYLKTGDSWFEKVLRGQLLPSSTIIITSRPNASVELRKSVHIRAEVLGFLKEQINEYIDTCYPAHPSEASKLKSYLGSHPNIRHMCYVPLNLAIIIFIYKNCQQKTTPLPETETDVYRQFTIMSLIRYFRKENRKIELRDLESLPSPEISMFQIISKLAYTTVIASKTSITQEELRPMCEESSIASLAKLGILVVDENEEEYGASHVFTFAHLTHQEFLAAYYISRLSSDEQLKAIREHIVQPQMGVVLKFFCGITKLQNPDHWAAIMDILLIDEKLPVTLRALHYVFESQNGQRCKELFSRSGGKLQIRNKNLTSLDYWSIGYCMELASDTVRSIELRCQLTAEGMDIIAQKLTIKENIKELKIRDNLSHKDKLLTLKDFLHKLPNVESLDLDTCFKDKDKVWSDWLVLGELLKENPHVQILNLSFNNLGPEGLKVLCSESSHFSSLTTLYLGGNNLGAEGMKTLCAASCHFSSLTTLNLGGNNIGPEGMKALCAASSHFPFLTTINLGGNNLGAEGMKALCAALSHFSSLSTLNLNDNNLGDDSIEYLIQIITKCPLESLMLSNRIGGNDFSYDSIQLLIQRAKSIRPGMKLDIPRPHRSTTTDDTPSSTSSVNPPISATTSMNSPISTTTVIPPRSPTTANTPTSPTAAKPPRSPTTANTPTSATTANSPTTTIIATHPTSTTTANPPTSTITANPPSSTTAANTPTSTTGNTPTSTTTANSPRSTTTANPHTSTTTANPPTSTTTVTRRTTSIPPRSNCPLS